MARFTKVERGLYRHTETGILYVRKYQRGKGEILKSTGETNVPRGRQRMDQILSNWARGEYQRETVLFEEAAVELRKIIQESKAPKTYKDYEGTVRLHLLPFFKGVPLSEVGKIWPKYKGHQKVINEKRKLKHDRKHLIQILKYAKLQGFIDVVPDLELAKSHSTPAIGREYTNEEINALLTKAQEKGRHKNTALKLEMQLKTGMRAGEVRLLKWEYIDFDRGLLTLPAEIVKTRYGRTYAVEPSLLHRIATQRKNGSLYVFPNRWDKSRPANEGSKGWQIIRKEMKLKGKLHWLRHTFVTRAIRGGAPAALVQKSVGMSDTVMKRVYLHANEDDARMLSEMVQKSLVQK